MTRVDEHSRAPFPFLRRVLTGGVAAALALGLVTGNAGQPAQAADAAPAFGAPDSTAADYYGALLRHTQWVNTVWDASIGAYKLADFDFAVVLGNAVLVTQGDYDAQLAGISEEDLRQKTVATIRYYAASNRFVDPKGTWGKRLFWDSTFQSYFLDAGRLMWDQLDSTTQANLKTIAAGQSTYTADLDYGRDPMSGSWTAEWPNGRHEDDTALEESGVYTQALAPGLAWAPDSPDAGRWAEQFDDWARNAAGQPVADANNPAVVGGKPISSNTMDNIYDTYVVDNHNTVEPHYQSDIWRSGGRNAIQFILNGQPIPEILLQQPNSAELWNSLKLFLSGQGEPFQPMKDDREFLYGRDIIPLAFLGQVLRDPDAARAEADIAGSLAAYQGYAPVNRLAKFSGEPKYEPEARAEIAISYLLHVHAAESAGGVVAPTPEDQFFQRLSGVRDYGARAGLTVQQSSAAWAAASSRAGYVKFPWVPGHDDWLFDVSGATPFLYPTPSAAVGTRNVSVYTAQRDGFDGTASLYQLGGGYAGQVTLPDGSAVYASTGAGPDDGSVRVRNLDMSGYDGLDGSRTYSSAEGDTTATLPETHVADPADAKAARVDDLAFEPVGARYVRIQGQQGDPTYGYSLYSLHVYGDGSATAKDLAAGKTATASSEDAKNAHLAAHAVDASASTRWAVSVADRTRADSWIQVDLGSSQTVSNVRLAWESSAGARYTVQTSEDGTRWTTRSAYGGAPADVNVARLDTVDLTPAGATDPGPVTARFVRMQGEQGDPAYGYSLYHLRALTPAGVDAAAGRPASASSADGSYPASAVTDGTATTRWAVSKADRTRADSWVQVDLGAPTAISQVQLGWESAAGRQYRVQTSLDGVTWQDAAAFRYTGDQILSSSGDWLDVEGKAGFVVRGSTAPITVSREGDATNVIRLADGTAGARLIEMLPADAAVTRARAAAAEPTTDAPGVLVSSLGGYLTAFNLTGADVKTTVVVPYTGAAVPLYAGTQQLGAQASTLAITLPAATAVVLAPRATVPTASAATGTLTATLPDARTVELTGSPATVDVTNVETGETRAATIAAPAVPTAAAGLASTATPAAAGPAPNVVVFASATAYPVADLALSTFTYPASVLPAGMTSPGLAVDGDAATAWVPGPGGRMVTDLGSVRAIGFVATAWDGAAVPDAQVAVSDDGITFTPVGTIAGGTRTGSLEVAGNARYVALTTRWRTGEAGLTALRVLPPGVAVDQPGDGTGPGGDPGEGTGPGGSTPGGSTPGGTGHGSDSAGRHDPDALSATGLSVAAGALLAALLLGAGAVLLVRRRKRTGRVH
ncbi:hypothetical protein LLS1_04280 [Leifsonia sp. LS1]|uniref:discoidin domain-containing protein n=1 Tax=Leifsonia sp. LS1 TaxID=2828483 RepID=UPI001CFEB0A0|nr:discoidin domain-containing protein [Leifsonia sp. LS1]GIT78759.1 hypothetical protein LLS1_04280 [Leifsonia sp. LS1]